MRPVAIALLLLLLPLAATVPAAPVAQSAPEWSVDDTWRYQVTTRTGTLSTLGDLTVRVVDEGEVRIGNATFQAYTLSERLRPWTPANASGLPVEAVWGATYTLVNTTVIIEKWTLCTLRTESAVSTVHGADVTTDHETVVYGPSDGRIRFPLAAGAAWNATFDLNRTRRYPFHTYTDKLTQTRLYECRGLENLSYRVEGRARNERGFHVRCNTEGSASTVDYWHSTRYGTDVRRDEFDAATGTFRTRVLIGHESARPPEILSSPQTVLALFFGLVALALLAGALLLRYLPGVMQRRRVRALERRTAAQAGGGGPAGAHAPGGRGLSGSRPVTPAGPGRGPVTPGRGPPAGPPSASGGAARGPGRSL